MIAKAHTSAGSWSASCAGAACLMPQQIINVRDRHLLWSEEQFTDALIAYARAHGWLACHFRAAWTHKGYRTPVQGDTAAPDVILVRGGILILAELKSQKGSLAPKQREWRDALEVVAYYARGAVEMHVWRPADWPAIQKVLEGAAQDD